MRRQQRKKVAVSRAAQHWRAEIGAETTAASQTQTPATGTSPSASPLAARRGFSRPALGRLSRRSEGSGARDESSRLIPPSRCPRPRTPAPSRDYAARNEDSPHPQNPPPNPQWPAEERRRTGRVANESFALSPAVQ